MNPDDSKITELLANQDSRLKLFQREIELHAERIKELQNELNVAQNIAQDSSQRSAAPLERLNYYQIQNSAAIEILQKRVDELTIWKVRRESQIDVWKWIASGMGGAALFLQLLQLVTAPPPHQYKESILPAPAKTAPANPRK